MTPRWRHSTNATGWSRFVPGFGVEFLSAPSYGVHTFVPGFGVEFLSAPSYASAVTRQFFHTRGTLPAHGGHQCAFYCRTGSKRRRFCTRMLPRIGGVLAVKQWSEKRQISGARERAQVRTRAASSIVRPGGRLGSAAHCSQPPGALATASTCVHSTRSPMCTVPALRVGVRVS